MLLAVAEHMDIQDPVIPRIATGMCSGMARSGGTCGAVSGGIMAISLVSGRNLPADDIDQCYTMVQEFLSQFAGRFGSLSCPELTGVQLGTLEGQGEFKRKGLHEVCEEYVGTAAGMVEEIINKAISY